LAGLAPLVLICWIIVSIIFFQKYSPPVAALLSVFGGSLFLPVYIIDLPGLPELNKSSIISIGLLLGGVLSDKSKKYIFKLNAYDLPMILWCFVSPFASSISNNLGLYLGLSGSIENFLNWGVIYWAGRKYFSNKDSLHLFSKSFIIGGIAYAPLILWELRMSPRLNVMIYGYFAHEWRQHFRYGGYRPIVFMNHGIMVALFMASSAVLVYWFWKSKYLEKVRNTKISYIAIALIITAIFCRTASGWFFLIVGIGIFSHYKKKNTTRMIKFLLLFIPVYIFTRISNFITAEMVESIVSYVVDDERVQSLSVRLLQEDLFSVKALNRPIFGWGGMARAWPVNPETGRELVRMIDALWIILFAKYGIFGCFNTFLAIGLGPWCLIKYREKTIKYNRGNDSPIPIDGIVLALLVTFFLLDLLFNGMVNPIYIMCSGAILSFYLRIKNNDVSIEKSVQSI